MHGPHNQNMPTFLPDVVPHTSCMSPHWSSDKTPNFALYTIHSFDIGTTVRVRHGIIVRYSFAIANSAFAVLVQHGPTWRRGDGRNRDRAGSSVAADHRQLLPTPSRPHSPLRPSTDQLVAGGYSLGALNLPPASCGRRGRPSYPQDLDRDDTNTTQHTPNRHITHQPPKAEARRGFLRNLSIQHPIRRPIKKDLILDGHREMKTNLVL